ncbi:hypothetical protein Kpol_1072p48 [Vanderwaltozyma polyspora DSM 70294]|uniref:Protein-tyrosine-phosphatase n=1 Tax=Vanderwaltozyma polyspora (strain ATCC 22028 / DSM 70294 / BCRC 21397 / CBS 2163 / NBRC 10782 / NRRL Y-8283 / UCD 57-17) TaxID=436907 RepID=A7TKR6_VANPO|nr:uncharacterized protein Kpol_1072p48 [Vanderwaltozyma polyspora DSM 70294]EDO17178.1 hypothetical protein Kpol_1072p48 [Vanderwaltozyma polyspora DSM 70294]
MSGNFPTKSAGSNSSIGKISTNEIFQNKNLDSGNLKLPMLKLTDNIGKTMITAEIASTTINSQNVYISKAPAAFTNSKTKVDLTLKEYHIKNLISINSIDPISQFQINDSNTKMLIVDLSTSNSCHMPNYMVQNNDNIELIHLPLPSTLVKRPNFDFLKLAKTAITNDNKLNNLTELIQNCSVFIFFDGASNYKKCSLSTYWFITKFNSYKNIADTDRIYLLDGCSAKSSCNIPSLYNEKPKKSKFNLTIEIPSAATTDDKNSMFIKSIKKDYVHYSPTSLKKYFDFDVPKGLLGHEDYLPTWLRGYVIQTDEEKEAVLRQLLSKFELLEKLENDRLEKSINVSTLREASKTQEDRRTRQNVYSLAELQKQYKKKKTMDSKNTSLIFNSDFKVVSNLTSHFRENQLFTIAPPNPLCHNQKCASSASTTPDSDNLVTPLDFYEISQGVQSFMKNRYSNILPYEHSRVKLQPSPTTVDDTGISLPPISKAGIPKTTVKRNSSYFADDDSYVNDTKLLNTGIFNDYFNANYLKLSQLNSDFVYIATQAPLPSTMDDFWKVVISNNVSVIVSLISDDELNMRKWDIYWNNNSMKKHDITIEKTIPNIFGIDGCVLRIFKVRKQQDEDETSKALLEDGKIVYQIQYTKWLDSCGVNMEDIIKLYELKNMIVRNRSSLLDNPNLENITADNILKQDKLLRGNEYSYESHPLLVHCSAGCGRTGVFITLDFLMNVFTKEMNANNKIDVWQMEEDLIFVVVNELRKQRLSMVQNLTQYITCYEALLQYFALSKNKEKLID